MERREGNSIGRETEPEISSYKPGVKIAVAREYLIGSRQQKSCHSLQHSACMINVINSRKKAYISDLLSLRYDTSLIPHAVLSCCFFSFLPKLRLT